MVCHPHACLGASKLETAGGGAVAGRVTREAEDLPLVK